MKLLLALLFPFTAFSGEPAIEKSPWPKVLRDFPRGEQVEFVSGNFKIRCKPPDDPGVQSLGGSGGPMLEFTVSDTKHKWSATFTEQSVGERLLESYQGKPQIEIWGRGGGGYWSRSLYRFTSGHYRCVRIDQFEERPRHDNQKAPTTEMPAARRGEGDQISETLYFVESRVPDT